MGNRISKEATVSNNLFCNRKTAMSGIGLTEDMNPLHVDMTCFILLAKF